MHNRAHMCIQLSLGAVTAVKEAAPRIIYVGMIANIISCICSTLHLRSRGNKKGREK